MTSQLLKVSNLIALSYVSRQYFSRNNNE